MIQRSILALLLVGLLIGVVAVVKPFTTAILFGAALATAVWPRRQALVRRGLGRGSAAALLLMLSLVVVVLPLLAFAPHLADQLVRGAQREAAYFAATPDQPTWIKGVPLFGGRRLGAAWDRIVEVKGTCARCWSPIPQNLEKLMIGAARGLADLVQVLLSLIVVIMFWTNGDGLVSVLHDALRRAWAVQSPSTRSTLPPARYAASPTA